MKQKFLLASSLCIFCVACSSTNKNVADLIDCQVVLKQHDLRAASNRSFAIGAVTGFGFIETALATNSYYLLPSGIILSSGIGAIIGKYRGKVKQNYAKKNILEACGVLVQTS